ncbi:MAG: hypothetical protein JO321_13635 [Solirubrobacterales bacterium]|nr:hypothetical protein [Solirubrobacterales bacterium]MBV9167773.1 hypothetical protein [Solirubrobacterales bacterium]MBV9536443.1 hypothetical protein [Solirubrobacterales bacterium]
MTKDSVRACASVPVAEGAGGRTSAGALGDRAQEEQWSYERFAEVLLSTEACARDSHNGEGRIKAARSPARKTLEEFDFAFSAA